VSGSVPLRATLCDIRRDQTANRGRWAGRRTFSVASVRREADDVVAIDLAPKDGDALPAYRPGQYVLLNLPGVNVARAYSLTGPGGNNVLSVAVKKQPSNNGLHLSEHIHRLAIGDEVQLESPGGIFTPPLHGD
ncbi:FAD-binding oxidoreductase, partial [Xanthomonas citri pv. citri]